METKLENGKDIKSQYEKMLAFNYGDNDKLILELEHGIKMYKACCKPNNGKAKERIKLYTKIIEYAKKRLT